MSDREPPTEVAGNVLLQNLRDFTVQILIAGTETIVGTGIAVSTDGGVVTCAHVVEAALGAHPRNAGDAEVGVYFPQARGGEEKTRLATVAGCFAQYDDDVVLLQLTDGPAPLAPEQITLLGKAKGSEGNPFRSYGYRRLERYIAGWADGTIQGCVECPSDGSFQLEPIQLESGQINCGMSGAAVLDVDRNLVVGIVSETWFPDLSTKDRDTAWAVNARVLSLEPIELPLRDDPVPKSAAPQPKTDLEAARLAVASDLGMELKRAPAPLAEWVGREELLAEITGDWADPDQSVTGLIGFGGEGKSSLVRHWLDNLIADETRLRPDGVFWWGFYDRPSVDEFFEVALEYMSGGGIDARQYPSSSAKAHLIAGMLYAGRYLFVLDGLEVIQHQDGDRYGLLRSVDLREFLSYVAALNHNSFCLVTSRAPLLDLMAYTTYTHRDVTRLSPADGRALLRELGVQGSNAALDRVVAAWDGHALTLGLLGGYLVEEHGGDITRIDEIPPPTAGEPRYERVHRVLRRYDEHLTDAERAFLTLFSAFRTPVEEAAFEKVFRADMGPDALNAPIAAVDDTTFTAMIERLLTYRILRHNPSDGTYTAHPLVRNHYLVRLTAGDRRETQDAHEQIKDYYLDLAGDTPNFPTLDDLAPLIEVVHHACLAGAYDEAERIRWERIWQRNRRVLIHELGAYGTALTLYGEFYPGNDTSEEPRVSSPGDKGGILNGTGLCLMNLGRLSEAMPFFERSVAIAENRRDWHNASISYSNLANLYSHLGALERCANAADEALIAARQAESEEAQVVALAWQGVTAHLRGDLQAAGKSFQQAETLQQAIDPDTRYLYSLRGCQHARYLRRAGDVESARCVAEANHAICRRQRWPDDASRSLILLGDLSVDAGQHETAREYFGEALGIARTIAQRPVLIEALLARGRWAARHGGNTTSAASDLNEALGYAVDSGYRIYEADLRVALAWAHVAAEDLSSARAEAELAKQMSVQMHYYWGQADADEVLGQLEAGGE